MASTCTHLDQVNYTAPAGAVEGCEDCLRTGGTWVHLRMCQICGHIGCCDSSPNKHASAHHAETGHPVMRSVEPGEDWSFCFEDQVMFRLRAG